jgi:hypothetical protein
MKNGRYVVVLAVPNLGAIKTTIVNWMLAQQTRSDPKCYIAFLLPEVPIIPHDHARNYLVNKFLKEADSLGADYLMLLDDDVTPDEDLLSMVENNVPICSGVAFVFNGEEIVCTASNYQNGKDGKPKRNEKGELLKPEGVRLHGGDLDVIPVDFVGGGCVLIRTDVLKKFKERGVIPYAFDYNTEGIVWQGEDYHFCKKAKELGFQTYVDRRHVCGHTKTVYLRWLNRLIHRYWKPGTHEADGIRHNNGRADAGEDTEAPRGAAG